MPGGFSDTGPVTYATSGVSSTTATRKVESTVEVDAATAASSVQFDTSGLDSSMDEYCRIRFFDRLLRDGLRNRVR